MIDEKWMGFYIKSGTPWKKQLNLNQQNDFKYGSNSEI
jgi:hypothetical protein